MIVGEKEVDSCIDFLAYATDDGACEPEEFSRRLVEDSDLQRADYIGTLLASLNKDISAVQANWLLALWRELELTDDEVLENQAVLLDLMSSPHLLVSIMAGNMIKRINNIQPIKAEVLIDMMARTHAVTKKGKSSLLTGLNLILGAMKYEPDMAAELIRCAAQTFVHGSSDIQGKVFEIIKDKRNPLSLDEIKELVAAYDPSLSPTMKARLKKWYRCK